MLTPFEVNAWAQQGRTVGDQQQTKSNVPRASCVALSFRGRDGKISFVRTQERAGEGAKCCSTAVATLVRAIYVASRAGISPNLI